jgi:hypothetical protein
MVIPINNKSIKDFGPPHEFLSQVDFFFLLGKHAYSGKAQLEGGFEMRFDEVWFQMSTKVSWDPPPCNLVWRLCAWSHLCVVVCTWNQCILGLDPWGDKVSRLPGINLKFHHQQAGNNKTKFLCPPWGSNSWMLGLEIGDWAR